MEMGSQGSTSGGTPSTAISRSVMKAVELDVMEVDKQVGTTPSVAASKEKPAPDSSAKESSSGVEPETTDHQMPVHGDAFPTLEAFQSRCSTIACSTIGYNYHAVSSQLAMVCSRMQEEHCRARVVVRKSDSGSSAVGWMVQGAYCHYVHSHEKHPSILNNPDWRPTVKLVKGFDEAKAATLREFDALNVDKTMLKSRNLKGKSASRSQGSKDSNTSSEKYPLPSVGSVYKSQYFLRTSTMKSNFDIGYHFTVGDSPKKSNKFARLGIVCKRNFPKYGDKRCSAIIRACPVDRSEIEGFWKISELVDIHNHPPENTDRPWKRPRIASKLGAKPTERRRNKQMSNRVKTITQCNEDNYEEDKSSDGEESDEDQESEYGSGDEEEEAQETGSEESDGREFVERKISIPLKRFRSVESEPQMMSTRLTTGQKLINDLEAHRSTEYSLSPATESRDSSNAPSLLRSSATPLDSISQFDILTITNLSSLLYSFSPFLLPYANFLFGEGINSIESLRTFIALPRESKRKWKDEWVQQGLILSLPGALLVKKLHELSEGGVESA